MNQSTTINWLAGIFLTTVREAEAAGSNDFDATCEGIRRVVSSLTESGTYRNPYMGISEPTTVILASQVDLLFGMILDSRNFWRREMGKKQAARLFAAVAELKEVLVSHDNRELFS